VGTGYPQQPLPHLPPEVRVPESKRRGMDFIPLFFLALCAVYNPGEKAVSPRVHTDGRQFMKPQTSAAFTA
jgi:hypothetical protein